MAEFGSYLTAINKSKKNIMRESPDDPKAVTGYPAFIIRRLLSYHLDAILFCNEINMVGLEEQLQFEFLLHALPKKTRYASTYKPPNVENLDLIKTFYNYSTTKALDVLLLHSPADIERIKSHLSEGGVIK
jgi:hypothetical protein